MSSSSAVGSMSAAAGAVVAKLLCADSDVQAHGQRLEEVKRQATQSSPAAIDPVVAVRHMLETVDWGLANEGRFRLHRASDFLKECLTLRWKEESEAQVLNGSIEKEYERHLHKVRHLCIAPSSKKAPVLRPKVYSAHSVEQPTEKDGSQRLFDPQHGTVRDKLGLCAALAYVVYEFLQLRHAACGSLQDSPRRSLRLALTALSQHDALAKGKEGESTASLGGTQKGHSWWQKAACAETDFRSAAITLICILDAALSWSPLDVFGWTGKPEDVESALLARQRDACSFSFFAEKLRTCLKTACSDSLKATSRIDFHFAAMRRRDLPKEWTTAWVRNDAGPMIVRNRTQVPLRIELRQANQAEDHKAGSIAGMLLDMFQPVSDQPVLAAHVEPGIEWAFRPKKEAGREFQLHMLTTSGVQVCSRRLARGESFDFHVEVPAKPAQLRTWMRAKKDVEFELEQLVASRRLSQASTASTVSKASLRLSHVELARSEQHKAQVMLPNVVDGFTSCLCPRCLSLMKCQNARPRASVYTGGVSCDHCHLKLLGEELSGQTVQIAGASAFCHCSRCQFDLCRACAYEEMQSVWWTQR